MNWKDRSCHQRNKNCKKKQIENLELKSKTPETLKIH